MTADRTDATWVCMRAWATRMWDRLQQALYFPDALGSNGGLSFSGTGLKGAAACVRRLFLLGGGRGDVCTACLYSRKRLRPTCLPHEGWRHVKNRGGKGVAPAWVALARHGRAAVLFRRPHRSFYMMCSLEDVVMVQSVVMAPCRRGWERKLISTGDRLTASSMAMATRVSRVGRAVGYVILRV